MAFNPFKAVARALGSLFTGPAQQSYPERVKETPEQAEERHRRLEEEYNPPYVPPNPDTNVGSGSEFEGDYPAHWDEKDILLWEHEPSHLDEYYDSVAQRHQVMDAFDRGWLRGDLRGDKDYGRHSEERYAARTEYYELTGMDENYFNWGEYEDWLQEYGHIVEDYSEG